MRDCGSLDVTQCMTMVLKRMSELQHMRHTHAGSPVKAIRTERLLWVR